MARIDSAITSVNALGFASSTVFDAASNPINRIDSLGRISTAVFDALNRQVAGISPLGYCSSVAFDATGRKVGTQNALGAFYSTLYDAASRPVAVQSPLGHLSSTLYNVANQAVAQQNALGFVRTAVFDAASRPVASIDPIGGYWTTLFDAASQKIGQVDPLGNCVTNVFQSNGWQAATQNALGYLTSFVRDAAGQNICLVDANNGRSTTVFSNRGFVSAMQDQLGALTSFTQDPDGNTILRVDARSWPTSYTVDALNRTSGQVYIDGTRVTSTWDSASQQITSQDVTGITSYVWDLDSRKIATQYPTAVNLTNTLDAVGNRLGLADPLGLTTYSYDQQNRLTEVVNALNEATSIQWDPLNRESQRVLSLFDISVSRSYDAAGREALVSGTFGSFSNPYDSAGKRIGVYEVQVGAPATLTLGYDASYQLVNEVRGGSSAYNNAYSFDPVGNRLVQNASGQLTTGTFSPTNELLTSTPPSGPITTSSYDPNGNLLLQNTGGTLTSYSWDPENRLLSNTSAAVSETYQYSQDGLRQSKTNNTSGTTFMVVAASCSLNLAHPGQIWDNENVLLEMTSGNVLQARYTNYPQSMGGMIRQWQNGFTNFSLFDSQRNTRFGE